MKIYLAGPITGVENYRENFEKAENLFRNNGWPISRVKNPVKIVDDVYLDLDPSWDECMDAVVPELTSCSHVYFLRGWEKSKGAKIEMQIALAMNKKIMMED